MMGCASGAGAGSRASCRSEMRLSDVNPISSPGGSPSADRELLHNHGGAHAGGTAFLAGDMQQGSYIYGSEALAFELPLPQLDESQSPDPPVGSSAL